MTGMCAAFGRARRAGCATLVACVIAGCHGGGDGDGSTSAGGVQQINVSPANVSFSASAPGSPLPPAQTVLVTLVPNSGALFFRVVVTGTAVASVDNVTMQGPTQARITIRPALPSVLLTGRHASTITVLVCNTDANCSGPQVPGSPVTINVAYQVGTVTPPLPESLAPSVGAAGVAGDVVLRGTGLGSVTSVTFDGTPAIAVTASDSEIRATYPALAPGVKTISLNGGTVPFGQTLTLVPAGAVAAATLPYPAAPQNVRGLAYDAVNQALFVGSASSNPANNQVLRYAFIGGVWQAPPVLQPVVTVPSLRDLTLSLDRTRLLAITDTALVELDPTLATQATTPRIANGSTTAESFLKGIVATNDNQAFIVSSTTSGVGFGQHWLYAIAARSFSGPFNSYNSPEIGGPDTGTRAVIVQGGGTQTVQQYNTFTGSVTPTSLALAHSHPVPGRVENINPPVFDRNGNRMLVAGLSAGVTFHAVYDANFDELGRLPSNDVVAGNTVRTAAYAISPDGARAYILQIAPASVCRVRAFDITTPPGPGVQFQEVAVSGFPINLLPNCPASAFDTPIRILVNPPGDTLFIAGNQSIRVVRLP